MDKNMNEKEKHCTSCHEIDGIVCDVRNCIHHDGKNCCTAGEIAVGPSYAMTSSETACATFKPKEI